MKILLIIQEDLLADVMSLAIEAFFSESKVISASSSQAAQDILATEKDFSAMICCASFDDGTLCEQPYKAAVEGLKIPCILVGDLPKDCPALFRDHPPAAVLQKPIDIKAVVGALESFTPTTDGKSQEKFCRVAIKTLALRKERSIVDLYVKLSEQKFVRVLKIGDYLTEAEINKFTRKNVTFLYAMKEDFLALMDQWMQEIQSISKMRPEEIKVEKAVSIFSSMHSMVHVNLGVEGYTPELKKLTEASVEMAVQTMRGKPTLAELLKKLKDEVGPYITSHSTALSMICCQLSTALDWKSETTFYKLCLASFLHDITLEQDEWAKFKTAEEIANSNLSEEEKKKILEHPDTSADLIEETEGVPGEVAFIVRQHHETADGRGFPKKISHKEISPISALFIIAHDIVDEMLKDPENFSFHSFLRRRKTEKKYVQGYLGTVFRALYKKDLEDEL